MDLLKRRIRQEGQVLDGNILKVGSFLNHQIDTGLLDEMGKEFARLFSGVPVTKIITIEASGIAIACAAARYFTVTDADGTVKTVPVVFAKKNKSGSIPDNYYSVPIQSFTHGKTYDIIVSKQYLNPSDSILIIDDFLANGCALTGLVTIIHDAGAAIAGAGIAIEKGFQGGGDKLRKNGLRIESLAIIESMSPETGMTFR